MLSQKPALGVKNLEKPKPSIQVEKLISGILDFSTSNGYILVRFALIGLQFVADNFLTIFRWNPSKYLFCLVNSKIFNF